MTRVLVIGHAGLAAALVRAARDIFGEDAACAPFDFHLEQTLETIKNDLGAWLDEQLRRGPALILTDLPGATPHNVVADLVESRQLFVVAGANLPMLLRALNHADSDPARLADLAVEGGLRAIVRSGGPRPAGDGT